MKRRGFLIGFAGVAGGGLLLGWASRTPDLTGDRTDFGTVPGETALNGWVRVAADGSVTVAVPRADVGQGITTALAALVAEELDVDWSRVRVEQPPQAAIYANTTMLVDGTALIPAAERGHWAEVVRQLAANGMRQLGLIATGGSSSVRDAWLPMRTAGAAARQLLVQAAAARGQVPASQCSTAAGQVLHAATGRLLSYGELAPAASRLSLETAPVLRTPAQWRLLGHDLPRLDVAAKVAGRTQYGIDVQVPKALYAAVRMAPQTGGEVRRVAPEAALARPGVTAVVTVPGGVAVVADQWWRAREAVLALDVEFTAPVEPADSARLQAEYLRLAADGHAQTHETRGDQQQARAAAGARVLTQDYRLPFQAHAALEPVNCTARVADGGCEVWVGHQIPTLVRWFAARTANVPVDRVVLHTQPVGGSFGRRLEIDMVVQAVTIAARVPGTAVKVVWTRDTDLRNDAYRPMALVRQRVAVDAQGLPVAWHTRVVTPSIMKSVLQRLLPLAANDLAPDKTAVDGAIDLPYAVPNLRVEHVPAPAGLPVGFWRSVGHSVTAFAVESMINELAEVAGRDPLAYRQALLAQQPRHLALLQAVAGAAGWAQPLPAGHGRGLALHASFGSLVATVIEVSVATGAVRVERITAAVDCGVALQPDNVRAQVEGGLLCGLASALYGQITVVDGHVQQSTVGDFPALRMADAPPVQVVIVTSPQAPMGGIGEVGVPPVAPALVAAIHAAGAGPRLRSLPVLNGSA